MNDLNIRPRPATLRWRVVQVWAVVALGLVVWGLARLQLDRTPLEATGRANLESLRPFWVASASAWAALTAMWWMLARRRVTFHAGQFLNQALIILTIAMAARATVLLTHTPSLSDDVYRYVLDGRNLAHGINPYLDTPG